MWLMIPKSLPNFIRNCFLKGKVSNSLYTYVCSAGETRRKYNHTGHHRAPVQIGRLLKKKNKK